MADVPIREATSYDTPSASGLQYDATTPDGSGVGPFVKLASGPCDMQGNVAGDWPDSGPWKQT